MHNCSLKAGRLVNVLIWLDIISLQMFVFDLFKLLKDRILMVMLLNSNLLAESCLYSFKIFPTATIWLYESIGVAWNFFCLVYFSSDAISEFLNLNTTKYLVNSLILQLNFKSKCFGAFRSGSNEHTFEFILTFLLNFVIVLVWLIFSFLLSITTSGRLSVSVDSKLFDFVGIFVMSLFEQNFLLGCSKFPFWPLESQYFVSCCVSMYSRLLLKIWILKLKIWFKFDELDTLNAFFTLTFPFFKFISSSILIFEETSFWFFSLIIMGIDCLGSHEFEYLKATHSAETELASMFEVKSSVVLLYCSWIGSSVVSNMVSILSRVFTCCNGKVELWQSVFVMVSFIAGK